MKTATYPLALAAILAFGPGMAAARQSGAGSGQQSDPLAAAARAAREQKPNKPAPKVWDNDNLPKQGGVSVVGQESAPAAANASTPSGSKQDQAAVQSEVDAAKKQLDALKGDLDIEQRKYALDQQTYYGKTNYADDKDGAAALQDEKDQIDSKQQDIDDLQKKIDDLSAKLGAPAARPSSESK
jgi:hypothetical protein